MRSTRAWQITGRSHEALLDGFRAPLAVVVGVRLAAGAWADVLGEHKLVRTGASTRAAATDGHRVPRRRRAGIETQEATACERLGLRVRVVHVGAGWRTRFRGDFDDLGVVDGETRIGRRARE